jgi:hypothetical protein
MNYMRPAILFLFMLILAGCVTSYTPENIESEQALVVEGLITDRPGPYTINLSVSIPLWSANKAVRMTGCTVWITDDANGSYTLKEGSRIGSYLTDSANFRGVPGRTYTLHIITNKGMENLNYDSYPMKMVAAPPVDSVYYEKKLFNQNGYGIVEGCQIFLNTHDPAGECRFYRWEYNETWEFSLPHNYTVLNRTCWISQNSEGILIKNSSSLENGKISRFPILTISNPVDRLSVKYSILVNQFSLNEDEFYYWEKIKNMTEATGGFYDIVPASIPSNVYCLDDVTKKVLGYFCVSSVTSKRIFIRDSFSGENMMYYNCPTGIYTGTTTIPRLNDSLWVIITYPDSVPVQRIVTSKFECVSCIGRGSGTEPSFWHDDK